MNRNPHPGITSYSPTYASHIQFIIIHKSSSANIINMVRYKQTHTYNTTTHLEHVENVPIIIILMLCTYLVSWSMAHGTVL